MCEETYKRLAKIREQENLKIPTTTKGNGRNVTTMSASQIANQMEGCSRNWTNLTIHQFERFDKWIKQLRNLKKR